MVSFTAAVAAVAVLAAAEAWVAGPAPLRLRRSAATTRRHSTPTKEDPGGIDKALPPKPPVPSTLEFNSQRDFYYGVAEVDIGEGYKLMREEFTPSWKDGECELAVVRVPLPMGMVIEDNPTSPDDRMPGFINVAEVTDGSNAAKAGIRPGDALRACTALRIKPVEDATAFIEANTSRARALFVADSQPFEQCMAALRSNADDGAVTMVVERRRAEE